MNIDKEEIKKQIGSLYFSKEANSIEELEELSKTIIRATIELKEAQKTAMALSERKRRLHCGV